MISRLFHRFMCAFLVCLSAFLFGYIGLLTYALLSRRIQALARVIYHD